MRKFAKVAAAVIVVLSTNSCSRLLGGYVSDYGNLFTAAPIKTSFPITYNQSPNTAGAKNATSEFPTYKWTMITVPQGQEVSYAALVALSSMENCRDLLSRTGLVSRGIDTDLDLTTTVLTALATAFTPISTTHALSAAASISSGWRSVLDADLWGKQSAAIIGTQIDSTYFAAMKDYIADLSARAGSHANITPALEVMRIQTIHRECDIDRALGALAAKAQSPAAATTPDAPKSYKESDIVEGLALPEKLNGTTWIVRKKTRTTVTMTRQGTDEPATFQLQTILLLMNSAHRVG